MIIKTDADEMLVDAREHVHSAIEKLAAIVVTQCDGHDEFNRQFTEAMRLSLNDLIAIRDRLNGKTTEQVARMCSDRARGAL